MHAVSSYAFVFHSKIILHQLLYYARNKQKQSTTTIWQQNRVYHRGHILDKYQPQGRVNRIL